MQTPLTATIAGQVITWEQYTNLLKLVPYLRALPEKKGVPRFDMGIFAMSSDHDTECGSAGCAVGHAPGAGIPKCRKEDWCEFRDRVFGLTAEAALWCFGSSWVNVDNTPQGAAERIEWMLTRGIPEDSSEQRYGQAPLCYHH